MVDRNRGHDFSMILHIGKILIEGLSGIKSQESGDLAIFADTAH